MSQRAGPGFATGQTTSAWSLAQRKRTRGSNRLLVEPHPTGLPAGSALIVLEWGPKAGSRFLLNQPVTSVGRHPAANLPRRRQREPPTRGVALGEGRFPRRRRPVLRQVVSHRKRHQRAPLPRPHSDHARRQRREKKTFRLAARYAASVFNPVYTRSTR